VVKYAYKTITKNMFEKLLSVLPYNPGLLPQLSFYAHRMREEAAIRRIGMFFIVLAFLVQFAAVINPPQQAAAASSGSNDLIQGGFSSAEDAYNHCMGGISGEEYGSIMHYFGIKCKDIRSAVKTSITVGGYSNRYFSMGRNSYGQKNPTTGKATGQQAYQGVPKNGTLYARHISSFYSNDNSTEPVLKLQNNRGETVYLMYACGNLVTIDLPVPSQATPPDEMVAEGITPPVVTPPVVAPPVVTPPTALPPKDCGAGHILYNGSCHEACPYNAAVARDTTACICPAGQIGSYGVCSPVCPYNNAIPASDTAHCYQPCPYNSAIPVTAAQCFKPCEYNNSIPADSAACKPCDKSTNQQDALACAEIHKKAMNVTQNVLDANNTTAQPNDVILYTLSAKNTGKANIDKYTFQETLGDVLDYADVVDLHGGTIDKNSVVTWPAEKILAGNIATHQITVKVKAEIPSTPANTANSAQFDLTMSNTYGDTINIKVPAPPVKVVQAVAAQLPNTGPGSTLLLAAVVVIISGYFYGRARLLSEESTIALHENSQG
jgi:uncharacterized repeat protein (TIGR01451 family)